MGIGQQIASATITGAGSYFRPGRVKGAITGVQVFNGQKDNLPNYVVEFQVQAYEPGQDVNGVQLSPGTHPVGSTGSFFNKLRPDIAKSVFGNLKAFCLAAFKQKSEDMYAELKAKGDPRASEIPRAKDIKEEDLDPDFIDNAILCNNSKAVGLVMEFEVIEKRNATNPTKATSRFKWYVRTADGELIAA